MINRKGNAFAAIETSLRRKCGKISIFIENVIEKLLIDIFYHSTLK